MALTQSIGAYEDMHNLAEQALASPKGLRVTFETSGQAIHARQRFYSYRRLAQKENTRIYGAASPEAGKSVYDNLVVTLEGASMTITTRALAVVKVEELK